jgi:hypothetical protein
MQDCLTKWWLMEHDFENSICTATIIRPRFQVKKNNKKFWEEQIAYFHSIQHGSHRNGVSKNSSVVAHVFIAAGTYLPSRCLATIGGKHIQTHRHKESKVIL